MGEIKEIECKNDGCDNRFKQYNSLKKFCSYNCAKQNKKPVKRKEIKPIQKMSAKRKKENAQYLKDRMDFLNKPENKICFIDGCEKSATTIEHTAGRIGSKYLDQKYWKPCCLEHNLELERNPELSQKYQLSKIHHGEKIRKKN